MKKKVLVAALLVVVVAAAAFAYFPRGTLNALGSAVLGVLSGGLASSRSGAPFAPAFDGDLLATGDVVRADATGRGLLTFFDGSTVSIDQNAVLRVESLERTPEGGIQLVLLQSAGRTWASVSQLVGTSRFEMRTPTIAATVRGTAFETIVETRPDGTTTTTIKTDEGQVLVQAAAGGSVTVGSGQQVEVQQGQQAPAAASPQPPSPKLRFTASAGVGLTVIDPVGRKCGASGAAVVREVPRCTVSGGSAVLGEVVPGAYLVLLTAAQPVSDAEIAVEGLGTAGTDFSLRARRSLAAGALVRVRVPIGRDGTKLSSSGLGPFEQVSNVCGAEAVGTVFTSEKPEERGFALAAFAGSNKGAPAAIAYSQDELTALTRQGLLAQGQLPAQVSDPKVTVDGAGVHLSADIAAGPLTVTARADIIAAAPEGKLVLKIRSLEAGPIPPAVLDQLRSRLEEVLATPMAALPLVVERVAFRAGCLALIGKTPS